MKVHAPSARPAILLVLAQLEGHNDTTGLPVQRDGPLGYPLKFIATEDS